MAGALQVIGSGWADALDNGIDGSVKLKQQDLLAGANTTLTVIRVV